MKLRRLLIDRMPGFERRGFRLDDIGAGLTLVVGPNGSGKTTACRALRGLLCPTTLSAAKIRPVDVTGDWILAGEPLTLTLRGTQATCRRRGSDADWPVVLAPHEVNAFTITIDDLFGADQTDQGIANALAKALAGGFDLAEVRDKIRLSGATGRKEAEQLRDATVTVATRQAEQEALRGEAERLQDYETRVTRAREAQHRLERVRDARDLCETVRKLAEIQSILAGFPPEMEELGSGERIREDAQRIATGIAKHNEQLEKLAVTATEAQRRISAAALPEGGVPDAELARQNENLERLRTAEERLATLNNALLDIDGRLEELDRTLTGHAENDAAAKLDCITAADLDRLEALYRELERIEAEQRAWEAELHTCAAVEPEIDPVRLQQAVVFLRSWLGAGNQDQAGTGAAAGALAGLAAASAVAAIALAFMHSPWWLLGLVATAAATIACRRLQQRAPAVTPGVRAEYERKFGNLGIPPPDTWKLQAVEQRLAAVEHEWDLARAHLHASEKQHDIRQRLDHLLEQRAELDRERAEIASRMGLDPALSTLALVTVADKLKARSEAKLKRAGLLAQRDEERNRNTDARDAVNAFLGARGCPAADSYASARQRSDDIARRAREMRDAAQAQQHAGDAKARAASALAELEQERERISAKLGFPLADENALELRLERLPHYRNAVQQQAELLARKTLLRTRVAEEAPDLLDLDLAELEAEKHHLEDLAQKLEPAIKTMENIRLRVRDATEGHALEEALRAETRARAALVSKLHDAARAAAGHFLLEEIETEYRAASQPAVVRHACRWFTRFTHAQYELRIEPKGAGGIPQFFAHDTIRDVWLAPEQLSHATRIQLFLAVRLAFAMSRRDDLQLPFILDEVLSSTDLARFRAVAECFLELVAEGRQVLYFTCHPDDAERWGSLAHEHGLDPVTRLNLAELAAAPPAPSVPALPAEAQPVPPPDERESLDAYIRRLGISAFDPHAGAAAAHVAWLVDTAKDLHTLLRARIETYGQLKTLLRQGSANACIDAAAQSRTLARGKVLEAVVEAYAVGRGTPLTREELREAGVTNAFIDAVAELAETVDWQAKPLLEALAEKRLKGFRKQALERMRTHLSTTGHLDERDLLDRETAWAYVLAAADDVLAEETVALETVRGLFDFLWESDRPTAPSRDRK